jgi:Cu-Zn family superoxide dismutase
LALATSACTADGSAGPGAGDGAASATATLLDPAGRAMGVAIATEVGASVRVRIEGENLPAGSHGAHVHTTGLCTPPKFDSAGPHWNPTSRKHGEQNPAGKHLGDLPNIQISEGGRGSLEYVIAGTSLAAMLDADGAALVIHATADDLKTDPSGNSGDRIACGAFG